MTNFDSSGAPSLDPADQAPQALKISAEIPSASDWKKSTDLFFLRFSKPRSPALKAFDETLEAFHRSGVYQTYLTAARLHNSIAYNLRNPRAARTSDESDQAAERSKSVPASPIDGTSSRPYETQDKDTVDAVHRLNNMADTINKSAAQVKAYLTQLRDTFELWRQEHPDSKRNKNAVDTMRNRIQTTLAAVHENSDRLRLAQTEFSWRAPRVPNPKRDLPEQSPYETSVRTFGTRRANLHKKTNSHLV